MGKLQWVVSQLALVVLLVALVLWWWRKRVEKEEEAFEGERPRVATHLSLPLVNVLKGRGWDPLYLTEDAEARLVALLGNGQKVAFPQDAIGMVVSPNDVLRLADPPLKRLASGVGHFWWFTTSVGERRWTGPEKPTRVAVLNGWDARLVRAWSFGMRTSVKTVPLAMDAWSALPEAMDAAGVDALLTYVVADSPLHAMLRDQALRVHGWRGKGDGDDGELDISRLQLTLPLLRADPQSWAAWWGNGARTAYERTEPAVALAQDWWVVDGTTGPTTKETFQTSDEIVFPLEDMDPSFQCVGDRRIQNRAWCNSSYDALGKPKDAPTVWDRPCRSDAECPYYAAAQPRGGCLTTGHCEWPVGMNDRSFRQATGAPFCYNCPDPIDPECCTKAIAGKPDYAFAQDFSKRAKWMEVPK